MEKRQGLSEKQEEFCRLLAEGKTTGEAERLIGFSKGYGWRLMRKEHIRPRHSTYQTTSSPNNGKPLLVRRLFTVCERVALTQKSSPDLSPSPFVLPVVA